ncbi:hypothetical protein [Planococcus citreus]|nr:hypothetical protein [Planococcus citreus]
MSKLFKADEKVRSYEQLKVSKEARYQDFPIKELRSGEVKMYEGGAGIEL